jgi:di/tripeptidase
VELLLNIIRFTDGIVWPDIQGAHAPGERVKVDTVEKCWKLLVTALESVR